MQSEIDDSENSYAGRIAAASDRSEMIGDDGDEIDLGKDDSTPAVINSIEDHDQYIENRIDMPYAQISPELAGSSFNVTIREFEKRGDGMHAYLVYKLETEVKGVVGYDKQHFETWRRFSDFLGLHGKLVEKYLSKGVLIPQPPEKSISAFTKTMTAMGGEVGKDRARQLERFISRLIRHPRVQSDCDLRDFLTIESDLPKAVQTVALSGFGMKKMLKSVQDVISKMTFSMEEGDSWFAKTKEDIDGLEESLQQLHGFANTLVESRKEMSSSGEQLGKSLSKLAACDESTSLSLALSALTDVTENASLIWKNQAEIDNAKFSESIQEYILLISSLKEVFNERSRVWQQWQEAKQTLTKKREQKTKIDLSTGGMSEKSVELRKEIEETIRKIEHFEQHFEDISKAIRNEVTRFEEDYKLDIKKMIIEFMESMIHTHTKLVQQWEVFEPHAHNVQL